jgi:diguanylate cyclase (GGDEF)-like protein/PAS domain S-box-containing protein
MRKKIILSLLVLMIIFGSGAFISINLTRNTVSELNFLVELHEVEEMRRSLIIDVKTVQSNVYTTNTPFAEDIDVMVNNMMKLEEAAHQCTECHHSPELANRIINVQTLIVDYEEGLSSVILTEGFANSMESKKKSVIAIGNKIISNVQSMSHRGTSSLNRESSNAVSNMRDVMSTLFITLVATSILCILVAWSLARSITRPVNKLLEATRMISSGKLGSTISYDDRNEFGELADHFNVMSTAIKEGYEELEKEVAERKEVESALSKSEKFLSNTFDSIRDPFCIFNSEFRIVMANEAYAELKDKKINELTGNKCYDVLPDKSLACKECVVQKTFMSTDPCATDRALMLDDGSTMWLDIFTYPIFDENGNVSHVIEYIRDVTGRKLTEGALKESEERYALASRGANDGLWDWDIKSNNVYYSDRWKSVLGFKDEEFKNNPDEWFERVHPDERMQVKTEITAHINGHTPHFENEHRIMHKDGSYRWMLSRGLAIRDASGEAYRFAGSMTEITDRKMAEEQLMFDALHDVLTGLPNRLLFMDRLDHAVNREKRHKDYLFAVLFLDIDRFKVLNDSLGHTIGDMMLIAVSKRLEESLRPGDTVARLGGDEFSILLEDLKDRSEAMFIAERIQYKLSAPFDLSGQEVFTSVSIGIVFNTTGYDHPENLLRNADIAMYRAKANGNARSEVFNLGMYADAVARLQLETDMRQAIIQNEFVLHYQPIISVRTGAIAGFEALVRWQHPERGLLPANEFISNAEETGMIINIGEWVIEEACRQVSAWNRSILNCGSLTMSVNLSSKQLLPTLVKKLDQVIKETGITPGNLILEITESMIMENAESIGPIMEQIKDMDIKIHIDDFGTGYSSLRYLHDFPVDALKIDRSFINGLTDSKEKSEIVNAIMTLAYSMNMDVVAEGVETEDQLNKMILLKCEYLQGFLFSKPLDSKKAEELLSQWHSDFILNLTHSFRQ